MLMSKQKATVTERILVKYMNGKLSDSCNLQTIVALELYFYFSSINKKCSPQVRKKLVNVFLFFFHCRQHLS